MSSSAHELILEGKAEPGDELRLLWRDELRHPFTQRITFDGEGKAVSGPCTATRIEGGWRLVEADKQTIITAWRAPPPGTR